MAITFTNVVDKLAGLGFYDFVLPWLLFFAVIIGVLGKAQVFNNKKVDAIIAAVIAFFIVAFVPLGGIMAYYSTLFGVGGMVIGVLLLIVILAGTIGFKISSFGGPEATPNKYYMPLIGLVLLVFAAWAFGSATGERFAINIPGINIDSDTWTIIFILAFVLLAVWYAEKGAAEPSEGTLPAGGKQKP